MEVCEDSARQYGGSENCSISFSHGSGDRKLQYSGDEMIQMTAVKKDLKVCDDSILIKLLSL